MHPRDGAWFLALQAFPRDILELYGGNGDKYRVAVTQERASFEKGEIRNPNLPYPRLKKEELEGYQTRIKWLEDSVGAAEYNIFTTLYLLKIRELQQSFSLALSTLEARMSDVVCSNTALYGVPVMENFMHCLHIVKGDIERGGISDNPDLVGAAKELEDLLPLQFAGEGDFELPREALLELEDRIADGFGEFIQVVDASVPDGQLDAHQVAEGFSQQLRYLNVQGWSMELVDKGWMSVCTGRRVVEIPARRSFSTAEYCALSAHEVFTHVQRQAQGEQSSFQLLSQGLDQYLGGEEGVALVREQAIQRNGLSAMPRQDYYLSICFALGMDGKPRDFREIYTIMEVYYRFSGLMKGESLDDATRNAKNQAWDRCVRTFRGTDWNTPGVCNTKDILYFKGYVNVLLALIKYPAEIPRLSCGKYDPSRSEHRALLNTLGITQ